MDIFAVPADLLTQPLLLVSTNGLIQACNVAFASSIGTTPEALRGRDVVSLITDTDPPRACPDGETAKMPEGHVIHGIAAALNAC